MSEPQLRLAQKIARALLPSKLFAAMEAESRQWKRECPACGFALSVWELGGIRYKAAGMPRRLARCPNCGESGWPRTRRERP